AAGPAGFVSLGPAVHEVVGPYEAVTIARPEAAEGQAPLRSACREGLRVFVEDRLAVPFRVPVLPRTAEDEVLEPVAALEVHELAASLLDVLEHDLGRRELERPLHDTQ